MIILNTCFGFKNSKIQEQARCHVSPSCAVLTTLVSGGNCHLGGSWEAFICFSSSPIAGIDAVQGSGSISPQHMPRSSPPLRRFGAQRRRKQNKCQPFYLLNSPHTHLALSSFSDEGGNQNKFMAYKDVFHAVFRGTLVYMRFWKCMYAWKNILSLSKKKQESLYIISWNLGPCGSVGSGRWLGLEVNNEHQHIKDLKKQGTVFPRNPAWESNLKFKNLKSCPGTYAYEDAKTHLSYFIKSSRITFRPCIDLTFN